PGERDGVRPGVFRDGHVGDRVERRRAVDRGDRRGHGRGGRLAAVGRPVGERVRPVEVGGRGVGERPVRVEGHGPERRPGDQGGGEGGPGRGGVVRQHPGGGDRQRRVLGGGVRVGGRGREDRYGP